MEITINELLEGKATIIKNKEYFATANYIKPFLEKMKPLTNDFRVRVKLPDQMTVGAKQDITYNRVLVEAVLPVENDVEGYSEVIGLVYGLDVRKPVSKLYRAYMDKATGNLLVFNPAWLKVELMEPEEAISTDPKRLMEITGDIRAKIKYLRETTLPLEEVYEKLGKWVDGSLRGWHYNGVHNVRLSRNHPVDAYKSLFIDEDSEYFISETKEASLLDVYNAFTQIVTDDKKEILNKFEKTLLINKLLEI